MNLSMCVVKKIGRAWNQKIARCV